jgi:hypothetical protein
MLAKRGDFTMSRVMKKSYCVSDVNVFLYLKQNKRMMDKKLQSN